jgi:tetratricopeptide (TPR) repeat protein
MVPLVLRIRTILKRASVMAEHRRWVLPRCLAATLLLAGLASAALADTVVVGDFERTDLKVQSYRNNAVEITVNGRRVDPIAADRVTRMALDNDSAFSAAEQAFISGDWQPAAEGYSRSLATTTRTWLPDWALPRMLQAADRAGRPDLAVSAFLQLLIRNPAQAVKLRPSLDNVTQVASAVAADLSKAAGNGALTHTQKHAALSLLLDIYRVQGDLSAARGLRQSLPSASSGASKPDPTDPAGAAVAAALQLSLARLALAEKDYPAAIATIETAQTFFTDPSDQADALYCLAAARDAQTPQPAPAAALKNLALQYMRVVAISRPTPAKRCIAQSLFRVAQIEEELQDKQAAVTLYAEVAKGYKGTSLADRALREVDRLGKQVE